MVICPLSLFKISRFYHLVSSLNIKFICEDIVKGKKKFLDEHFSNYMVVCSPFKVGIVLIKQDQYIVNDEIIVILSMTLT